MSKLNHNRDEFAPIMERHCDIIDEITKQEKKKKLGKTLFPTIVSIFALYLPARAKIKNLEREKDTIELDLYKKIDKLKEELRKKEIKKVISNIKVDEKRLEKELQNFKKELKNKDLDLNSIFEFEEKINKEIETSISNIQYLFTKQDHFLGDINESINSFLQLKRKQNFIEKDKFFFGKHSSKELNEQIKKRELMKHEVSKLIKTMENQIKEKLDEILIFSSKIKKESNTKKNISFFAKQFDNLINKMRELESLNEKLRKYEPELHKYSINILNEIKLTISKVSEDLKSIFLALLEKNFIEHIEKTVKELETIHTEILNNQSYLIFSKKEEYFERITNILESTKKAKQNESNCVDILNKNISEEIGFDNLCYFNVKDKIYSEKLERAIYHLIETAKKELIFVETHNELFIDARKKQFSHLFTVNKDIKLDQKQQEAIIIDDKHNLVVAAAGSGKTEVLITRIKYLLERPDKIHPNRILALAFQSKASKDIKKRLGEKFDEVEVRTFHSLGRKILKEAKYPVKISLETKQKMDKFIRRLYEESMKNTDFANLVFEYIQHFGDSEAPKQESDFETKEKFYSYQRNLRYITLNGIKVKSEAERSIMNFFLSHNLNGKFIDIRYEAPAAWMAKCGKIGSRIPEPDFYFPDYKIYIENWAINKEGKVPIWFETSSEDYNKTMKIKKQNFANQKENYLIETFAYETQDKEKLYGILKKRFLKALNEKYPSEEFTIEQIPHEELVEKVWAECKGAIKSIHSNISTFIIFAKNYDLSINEIKERIASQTISKKQKLFAEIAVEIFHKYDLELKKIGEIDFNDMINLAKKELLNNENLFKDKYDQILIDEFQDISKKRCELIKILFNKNQSCRLFCVGDDWQSIMGFAGSSLEYFVNFENYFEKPAITKLEVNYRSRKEIVTLGNTIIYENGDSQIQKNVKSNSESNANILLITSNCNVMTDYHEQTIKHCMATITNLLTEGYQQEEIMILYRARTGYLTEAIERLAKNAKITLAERGGKGIQFMTIHKSKGLEAKAVFVLNLIDDLYGLPCKVENPDILEIVNDGKFSKEQEERRLFYVAVTRAKEKLFIYTKNNAKSPFLKNLNLKTKDLLK